nr:MAG TPA: hypothetical protein [Caudoviricetes sp.]
MPTEPHDRQRLGRFAAYTLSMPMRTRSTSRQMTPSPHWKRSQRLCPSLCPSAETMTFTPTSWQP